MSVLGRGDAIEKAVRQYNRGDVDDAAWTLYVERARAAGNNDAHRLAEVDEAAADMLKGLAGDPRLRAFEAHLAGREDSTEAMAVAVPTMSASSDQEVVDVTPLSLGIALVGAGVTLLSVFLPQFESNTFLRIEKNSLIQNGDGWWFIAVAVIGAVAAYRAYSGSKRTFGPVIFGVIGILLAIFYGTAHSQRRLCSAASGFQSNCTLATPGIGIYAAGVGGLLLVIGGWQMFRADTIEAEEEDESAAATAATAGNGDRASEAPPATIADRLRTLDQLKTDGLITDDEYAQRRAALLEQV